jgi:hypothetical protein
MQVDTVDVLSAMTGVTVPKATYNTALWSSGILSLLLGTALLVWFVCWAKPLVQAVKYMFNPYAMVSASKEVCTHACRILHTSIAGVSNYCFT